MCALLTPNLESRCPAIQAESQTSFNSQYPLSLKYRVFVCIEILINCSSRPHSGHRVTFLWVHKFMLYSSPFPIQTGSNWQTQSVLSVTAGPIKALMFWSGSLKQSFTWRKKRTHHNAINHVRVSGFIWCHGQLQKALLVDLYSFYTDLCKIFEDLIRCRCWYLLFKATPQLFRLAIKVDMKANVGQLLHVY